MAGDFSLPLINWELLTAPDDGVHDVLLTMCLDCRLHQIITEPTRQGNILDIVFSNNSSLITHYHLSDPLGAGDHDTIIFKISLPNSSDQLSKKGKSGSPANVIIWSPNSIAQAQ